MIPALSNIFHASEDSDYVALMQTEYRRDYERARADGHTINKKFVRKFLRTQGFQL